MIQADTSDFATLTRVRATCLWQRDSLSQHLCGGQQLEGLVVRADGATASFICPKTTLTKSDL